MHKAIITTSLFFTLVSLASVLYTPFSWLHILRVPLLFLALYSIYTFKFLKPLFILDIILTLLIALTHLPASNAINNDNGNVVQISSRVAHALTSHSASTTLEFFFTLFFLSLSLLTKLLPLYLL